MVAAAYEDRVALVQAEVAHAVDAEGGVLSRLQGDVHRLAARQDDGVLRGQVRRYRHDDQVVRLRVQDRSADRERVGRAPRRRRNDDAVAAVVRDAGAVHVDGELDGAAKGR